MQVLHPAPNVMAFYDGRIPGVRLWSDEPNWLDDGAFTLGCCSYAVIGGTEALVYDTHMSLDHACIVRRALEASGVRSIRVVLSHWHADHVAGNEVFRGCEIIANGLTAARLVEQQRALESGSPPIDPLVLPTRTFEGTLHFQVGAVPVVLQQFDIHSRDGTVLVLPEQRLLLAGDTLEDPVTYVTEPDRLERHLGELDRLASLPIDRILPNHGAPDVIAAGGYDKALIGATHRYVAKLLRSRREPALAKATLEEFIADDLRAGTLRAFAGYEAVHRRNLAAVLA